MRPGARPADIRLAYRGADRPAARRRRRAADRDRASARCATRRRSPTRRSAACGVPVRQPLRAERRARRTGSRSARYDRDRELVIDPSLAYSTLPRRHEPRDRQRHPGRRGGQRLRDRLHPVAELPDHDRRLRPHRLGEQQPRRVRHQAQPDRHGARLLDVPRRRQLRVGPRHRGRLGGQRVRDRQDDVLELPDHRRRVRPHVQRRQLPALRHRPGRRVRRQAEPRGLGPRLLDVPRRHAARRDVRHRDRRRAQRVRDGRDDPATSRRRPAPSTRPPTAAPTPSSPSSTPTGSALVYSTRLGGADNELPEDVAVDAAGNATVGGSTRSADFPTTPGAFDTTQNGGAFDERFDLFVTKLNAAGSGLVYSTFVGGSKSDFGDDFALDAAGNAYLVGGTLSPDFPTTPGTFDPVFAAASEGFVAQAQPDRLGARLLDVPRRGRAPRPSRPTPNGNAWLAGGSGPGGTTTADAFDPLLQRRRGRRVRREAERDRLGAHVRELPRRLGVRGRRRRRARRGRQRLPHRPHVLRRLHRPRRARSTATCGGDTTIFWGDAFVAKVDVDGTAPPQPPPPPAARRAGARQPGRRRRGRASR